MEGLYKGEVSTEDDRDDEDEGTTDLLGEPNTSAREESPEETWERVVADPTQPYGD